MVRLAARFDLEIDPETREAARRSREALVGVSPERVLAELVDMLARAGSGRAVGTLTELGLLERAVPGWAGSGPGRELRRAVVAALPDPPGAALGLAALFGPDPRQAQPGPSRGVAHELLAGLRPPRKLSRRVFEISDLAGEVVSRSGAPTSAAPSRAGVIRLVRRDEWTEAAALARAWCVAAGLDRASLDRLEAARAALSEEELFPARLLEARELLELGVERGPLLGTLLVELEDAQLDERVRTPEDARAWLERRMREGGRPSSGERSSAGPS
jgi:tRNA nucleotidyltransferase/poly(A) polymerase